MEEKLTKEAYEKKIKLIKTLLKTEIQNTINHINDKISEAMSDPTTAPQTPPPTPGQVFSGLKQMEYVTFDKDVDYLELFLTYEILEGDSNFDWNEIYNIVKINFQGQNSGDKIPKWGFIKCRISTKESLELKKKLNINPTRLDVVDLFDDYSHLIESLKNDFTFLLEMGNYSFNSFIDMFNFKNLYLAGEHGNKCVNDYEELYT